MWMKGIRWMLLKCSWACICHARDHIIAEVKCCNRIQAHVTRDASGLRESSCLQSNVAFDIYITGSTATTSFLKGRNSGFIIYPIRGESDERR